MLGAPLQFFPALGTKELDDLVDAYVPGAASLKEKRATVSVDFFDYTQVTGQTFKFYPVPGMYAGVSDSPSTTPLQTPVTASPVGASSVTSTWDWSSVAAAPTPASTSSSKPRSRASPKKDCASLPRQSPADVSHIPGMKILTKDGLDVTNAASRGCKTKEQRDHAHLMRIIKACESCRKKKVKCDPSHKRRAPSSAAQSQSRQPAAKSGKKVKASPVQHHTPAIALPEPPVADDIMQDSLLAPLDLGDMPEFSDFNSLDLFGPLEIQNEYAWQEELWKDFVHHPPAVAQPELDLFDSDSQGLSATQDWSSSSTPASPFIPDDQLFTQAFAANSASDVSDQAVSTSIESISPLESPVDASMGVSSTQEDVPMWYSAGVLDRHWRRHRDAAGMAITPVGSDALEIGSHADSSGSDMPASSLESASPNETELHNSRALGALERQQRTLPDTDFLAATGHTTVGASVSSRPLVHSHVRSRQESDTNQSSESEAGENDRHATLCETQPHISPSSSSPLPSDLEDTALRPPRTSGSACELFAGYEAPETPQRIPGGIASVVTSPTVVSGSGDSRSQQSPMSGTLLSGPHGLLQSRSNTCSPLLSVVSMSLTVGIKSLRKNGEKKEKKGKKGLDLWMAAGFAALIPLAALASSSFGSSFC